MKLYKKLFSRWTGVAMLATMGLFACQPEIEVIEPVTGSADFTTYIALGNSLTSGYADGALYREGQINSFPEMIAKSMQEAGGANGFKTPLMPEGNGIGIGDAGLLPKLELTADGFPLPSRVDQPANPADLLTSIASGGPYQNMGVPGAKSFHLVAPGYGSSQGNPFFTRFATSPATTVVADAAAQNPTFFTLWIGNNDVLGYALAGGDQGNDPITPTATFEGSINGILQGMDNASGGAIANIPDILEIPYFTTIAYNSFPIEDATQAAQLNGGIELVVRGQRAAFRVGVEAQVKAGVKAQQIEAGLTEEQAEAAATAFIASPQGQALVDQRTDEYLEQVVAGLPKVQAGNNPYIIQGAPSFPDNPTGLRAATENDLILFTAPGYLREEAAAEPPRAPILPESYVLDVSEQAKVDAAIAQYNDILQAAAGSKYAYVDMSSFFNRVKTGYVYQGINYDARFVLGGAFSLDGVHLTQRGYALAGNEFIKAINTKYNAKLSWINVNDYKGITFP